MPKAILELEMPENCWDCPLIQGRELSSTTWCGYNGKDCPVPAYQGRRSDCPLKLVKGKDEQTNVKCRYCNSENVEIVARGTESILYKCKACKMEFAKLNIKEG